MRVLSTICLMALAAAVGGGGSLYADQLLDGALSEFKIAAVETEPQPVERKILHYRDPMGGPEISPVPKKDSMGMDFIPVYEGDAPVKPEKPKGESKILYYRNPMGLPDTSPAPKKDSMGMDYIPVYEDETSQASDGAIVKVSLDRVQRSGVRSEAVERRVLTESIHAPGTVQMDERRERSITMRTEGYVEAVYSGATGQHVKAGEPLFRIYSRDIVQAQVDYRVAAASGAKQGGARKLLNYGLPESFIKSLDKKGDMPLALDWPSPVDGVLMRKNIVVGSRVMPGDELYRLVDISSMWVIADVPEKEIGRIKVGDKATITVRALPSETFYGTVAFILPELKAETRTAQVRIELPNPEGKLIHQMFAEVTIDAGQEASVLAVPASAIMDSGMRQVTIVDLGNGRFSPRPVKLGRRNSDFVEVREGLKDGDKVVTKANFLIDAESNLQAALAALATDSAGKP